MGEEGTAWVRAHRLEGLQQEVGPSGVTGRRAEMRLESGQRPTHMWPGGLGEISKEQ